MPRILRPAAWHQLPLHSASCHACGPSAFSHQTICLFQGLCLCPSCIGSLARFRSLPDQHMLNEEEPAAVHLPQGSCPVAEGLQPPFLICRHSTCNGLSYQHSYRGSATQNRHVRLCLTCLQHASRTTLRELGRLQGPLDC